MGRNATAFETTQNDDFCRAPEPGYLDAERKPGTSRIQRRVELKFWPKLGQTGPENHFVTVSIKARYRQPRIYVVSGYFVVYLRSLPSYEGTTFVRSYLRTYLPPIKYIRTKVFFIYLKYEGTENTKVDYEGTKVDTNEGTKVRRYVFCDDCVRTNETRSTPVAGNLPS